MVDSDLSDSGKKIVKQWRLEKYISDLNNYKEKGYFIDEEKKIVITDREILMFREDSEVPYWDKITSLVKEAYNRIRITPQMMELVKKILRLKQWIMKYFVTWLNKIGRKTKRKKKNF